VTDSKTEQTQTRKKMDAQRNALIAAMAQDMENMIGRMTELVRMSTEMRPLAYPWWETMESQEQSQEQEQEQSQEQEQEQSQEAVPCGCTSDCPHECSVCLKALTLRDSEGLCWMCEEDLVTVEKEWPEDSAEAKRYSNYREGAYHALILRYRANVCREASEDTDDAEEVRECLQESKRLDARASDLLYKSAAASFKPWWYESWDYWMQPGSAYNGDKSWAGWRSSCANCTTKNGFHVGACSGTCLAVPSLAVAEISCSDTCTTKNGFRRSAPQPEAKAKPAYNHALWPSPRPKLYAKTLGLPATSHRAALQSLADHAGVSLEELLTINPLIYETEHMAGKSPPMNRDTRSRLRRLLPSSVWY